MKGWSLPPPAHCLHHPPATGPGCVGVSGVGLEGPMSWGSDVLLAFKQLNPRRRRDNVNKLNAPPPMVQDQLRKDVDGLSRPPNG